MKMTMSKVNIEKIFPIIAEFDDVIVNRKGVMTIGWEVSYPELYSCDARDYDIIHQDFVTAIKILPAWSVVHKQDRYFTRRYESETRGDFLGDEYMRAHHGRTYTEHKSYIFVSLGTRGLAGQNGTSSGIFGRLGNNILIPSLDEFTLWRNKCNEFASILTSDGKISLRLLHTEDYFGNQNDSGIIQSYMMLGNASSIQSHVNMSPDKVSVYNKTAVCFAIAESEHMPGVINTSKQVSDLSNKGVSEVFLSYGAGIGSLLPCDHIVNQYVVVPVQSEIVRQLDKECKAMTGGISSTDNRINSAEIREYLDDVEKEGLFTVLSHTNILAWDDDDKVSETVSKVTTALSGMGVNAIYNSYNTPVLYYAGIPGAATDLGKENLMTQEMESILCLGVYETFEKGIEGGFLRMCDRTRLVPLPFDIQKLAQAKGYINNYNCFILGGSGSGKSFFTNNLVSQSYHAGEEVFIIDVGDSYEGLAQVINEESGGKDGIYMSWDNDHPLSFNVFDGVEGWLTDNDTLRTDEDASNFFFTLLQTIWIPETGWTTERKAILSQIITDFLLDARRREITSPLFDDFYRYVDNVVVEKIVYVSPWEKTVIAAGDTKAAAKVTADKLRDYQEHGYWAGSVHVTKAMFDAQSFVLSMKNYAKGGMYEALFNNPAPQDIFTSRFTVIEVDKLSQQDAKYYSVCILAIMNAFDIKMRRSQNFKMMIIEEAWKAISNETMAPYLAGLWKTARKFNTSATVVTQEVDDILSNPFIKTAIIDNSAVKILLDQSNHLNSFDRLQAIMSLTDKDKNLILSLNRANNSDYFYKEAYINLGGKKSAVFATEVSKAEALAFESNKTAKASLLERAKEIGYINAIKEKCV